MKRLVMTGADNEPVAGLTKGTIALVEVDDASDYTAAINPKSNLSSVRFHTDLDYLRIAKTVTSRDPGMAAVTIPSRATNQTLMQENQLFAHGMGFSPLLISEIEIDSYKQPCNGSALIMKLAGTANNPRWSSFTADDTYVYMYSLGWFGPAATIHWSVRVLDEQFQVTGAAPKMLHFDPASIEIPRLGKIDADHRFVRRVTSGSGDFRFIGKQTLKFDIQSSRTAINYSDGVTNKVVPTVDTTPYPSASYTVTGVECET